MGSAAAHLHFCEWKQSQQTLFRVSVCVFLFQPPPPTSSLFSWSHICSMHPFFLLQLLLLLLFLTEALFLVPKSFQTLSSIC